MVSSIDATKPVDNVAASKADLRANLSAAKTEIEALQAKEGSVVSIMDFVTTADRAGVAAGTTDATPAFQAIGAHLRSIDNGADNTILFPPGNYNYTEGWHLTGIKRLKIIGNGATIHAPGFITGKQNAYFLTQSPFYFTSDLENNLHRNDQTFDLGYPINTVAQGAISVTLQNSADASFFQVGEVALLHGFDTRRSNNYPPSLRNFEWVIIESIVGDVVTFRGQIKNTYREEWIDFTANSGGSARLLPWEGRKCCLSFVLDGVKFEPKLGSDLGRTDNRGNLSIIARRVDFRNVEATQSRYNPQVCESINLENFNCRDMEFDKIVGFINMTRCSAWEINEGTSCFRTRLDTVNVENEITMNGFGEVEVVNCNLPSGAKFFNWAPVTYRLYDNFFAGSKDGAIIEGYRTIDEAASTPRTFAVVNSSGRTTEMIFPQSENIWKTAREGDVFLCQPETGSGPVYVVVDNILQNVSAEDRVLVRSSAEILPNGIVHQAQDAFGFYMDRCRSDDGLVRVENMNQPIHLPRDGGEGVLQGQTSFFDRTALWEFIRRAIIPVAIEVDVIRPYIGTDASASLRIAHAYIDSSWVSGQNLVNSDFDLKTAGRRIISAQGSSPAIGADSFTELSNYFSSPDRIMVRNRCIVNSSIGDKAITGDANNSPDRAVMPIVSVSFKFKIITSDMIEGICF